MSRTQFLLFTHTQRSHHLLSNTPRKTFTNGLYVPNPDNHHFDSCHLRPIVHSIPLHPSCPQAPTLLRQLPSPSGRSWLMVLMLILWNLARLRLLRTLRDIVGDLLPSSMESTMYRTRKHPLWLPPSCTARCLDGSSTLGESPSFSSVFQLVAKRKSDQSIASYEVLMRSFQPHIRLLVSISAMVQKSLR